MGKPLPVACTLPAGETVDRRARWERLAARAAAELEPTPHGVRLLLRRAPDVEAELGALVALERECCAFARWTVTAEDGRLVLAVEADGAGADAVRAIFGAPSL